MYYMKPAYYDRFACTADKCHDTCCQDWEIIIDDESMKRYKKMKGEIGERVRAAIGRTEEKEPCFSVQGGHCGLLTEDGLCSLQMQEGVEALSKICIAFPRHIEEYDGVREWSVDPSCEEAARLILTSADQSFIAWEDEKGEEDIEAYDDFDYFLYSEIDQAREVIFDRLIDLDTKNLEAGILRLAHEWQGNIDRGEGIVFASDAGTPISSVDDLLSYETEKELFSQLFRLEVLRPGWSERLSKAYHKIFDSKESYEHYCEGIAECQQYERRLIRYMIYVYFCGAAYDMRLFARAALAVFYSRWAIMLYLTEEDEVFCLDDLVKSVYIFTREAIHSDTNLEALLSEFDARCPLGK